MHGGHHHHNEEDSDQKIIFAITINFVLTISQIIGGVISGSLALIADALHNLSDAASLVIAFFARKIGRKSADEFKTFGYKRAEIIASLINLTLLIVLSLYLIYEAIWRFIEPVSISGWIIVFIAGIAFLIDLYTSIITYKLSHNNMNMRAAFLHNLSDALASIGVIIGGILIILYNLFWVDALITIAIGLYILWQGIKMLPESINFLMDGTPKGISVSEVREKIIQLDKVTDTHHIHIWNLDEKRVALEAHVVVDAKDFTEISEIKRELKKGLEEDFGIDHSTLEFEHKDEDCDD